MRSDSPRKLWGKRSSGQKRNGNSRYRQGFNASLLPSGLEPSPCWASSRSGQGLAPYWSIPACTREAHHSQQTSCWSCKREVIRLRTWEEREAARPGWSCLSRAAFGPRRQCRGQGAAAHLLLQDASALLEEGVDHDGGCSGTVLIGVRQPFEHGEQEAHQLVRRDALPDHLAGGQAELSNVFLSL